MDTAHHIAVTVPDLEQAESFFCQTFDAVVEYREGPISGGDGQWMSEQLNVDSSAELRAAMLTLPGGMRLELFQYNVSNQRRSWPRNSDYGAMHLAIEVTDIEDAVQRLERIPEVRFLGTIQTETSAGQAGNQWIYFLTPWRMQMELLTTSSTPSDQLFSAYELAPW